MSMSNVNLYSAFS